MPATICHPGRKHVAHGLCRNCYQAEWARRHPEYNPNDRKQNATCHTERKMVAHGLCNACNARKWSMSRLYGISWDEYHAIEARQGGCCAICGLAFERARNGLHVDHDHETGVVRGLLCQRCNNGIGCMNDDPAILRKAIAYLEGDV